MYGIDHAKYFLLSHEMKLEINNKKICKIHKYRFHQKLKVGKDFIGRIQKMFF